MSALKLSMVNAAFLLHFAGPDGNHIKGLSCLHIKEGRAVVLEPRRILFQKKKKPGEGIYSSRRFKTHKLVIHLEGVTWVPINRYFSYIHFHKSKERQRLCLLRQESWVTTSKWG